MPYYVDRPSARRVEQWDGENIDLMREFIPGFFDYYEIDPETLVLRANGFEFQVGDWLINYGGSPTIITQEELAYGYQQVNKERPAFVVDADDVSNMSLRKS
jgi:hypothetical protein